MSFVQKPLSIALFGLMSLIIATLNGLFFDNFTLGLFCLCLYCSCVSSLFSNLFRAWTSKTIGFLFSLSILSIFGSIIYYTTSVTFWNITLLCAVVLIFGYFQKRKSKDATTASISKFTPATYLALGGFLISLSAWWYMLSEINITESIRSVWSSLNPISLLAIFLGSLFLLLILESINNKIAIIAIILLFISTVSVAVVCYPLGFGFDPFIHQATVSHIAEFGTISPKPFYYIGQYILELISYHTFSIPINLVDIWLMPILSGILLVGCAWIALCAIKLPKRVGIFALFLLPLGSFISTTPQSLAYIFTLCLLFLFCAQQHTEPQEQFWPLFVFALATVAIHPLAGIPALLFIVIAFLATRKGTRALSASILSIILAPISAISLPLIFLYQAYSSGLAISFSLKNIDWSSLAFTGFFSNRFSTILDGAYLIIDNRIWILLTLSAIGVLAIHRLKLARSLNLLILGSGLWLINYLILSLTLSFEFLIEYERTAYADRLLTLCLIFLIPHAMIAISWLYSKIPTVLMRFTFIIFLSLIITAQAYGAYPRHDNYARSAGFNMSKNDINAVYNIEKYSNNKPYIVLANQAVSSAALAAFGFKTYYNGDIFYYPIPTGGELYTYYLEMIDKEPSRETMMNAMDVAGVNLGFFIVNDYWWQSDRIIEHAKKQADDWFSVGDGAVNIFIFSR